MFSYTLILLPQWVSVTVVWRGCIVRELGEESFFPCLVSVCCHLEVDFVLVLKRVLWHEEGRIEVLVKVRD